MENEQAETLALRALAYIGTRDDALRGLLLQTGMAVEDLRANAASPVFLAGVMDYLLQWEDLAVDFCIDAEIKPESLGQIRRALPGGDTYEY